MKYIFVIFDKKKHNQNYKPRVVFFHDLLLQRIWITVPSGQKENICPSIKKSMSIQAKLFQVNHESIPSISNFV